jgi:hypothetical protein
LILGSHPRINTQGVSESEPFAPDVAVALSQMQTVGCLPPVSVGGLLKSMRLRAMLSVLITQVEQGLEGASGRREVAHGRDHVDDRLGSQPRNSSRSDVLEIAIKPGAECPLEDGSFRLETARPVRVVRTHNPSVFGHCFEG